MFNKKIFILWFLFIVCVFIGSKAAFAIESDNEADIVDEKKWAVVYTGDFNARDVIDYNPIALDSDHYPDLTLLKEQKKQILGYVSLGEIENYRNWYAEAKDKGLLLHENKNWPGSYYADVRNPAWTEMVVNDIIPNILRKGFSGIMVDTLDNPIELERYINSTKFKGIEKATVNLIKTINYHFPNMPIMINRGFEIIPEIGPYITSVLAESTYAGYDFENKQPKMVTKEQRKRYVDLLTKIKKDFPHIQIVTLDYWDPADVETVKKIYTEQRKLGFIPYVSTIELDKVIKEPENEK